MIDRVEVETGESRMVAYLVTRAGQAVTPDGMRTFLSTRLPDYMIPAAFGNCRPSPHRQRETGSIGLTRPGFERPQLATRYAEPRDVLERTVARTWEEVLGLERVGLYDNFFDLGATP